MPERANVTGSNIVIGGKDFNRLSGAELEDRLGMSCTMATGRSG